MLPMFSRLFLIVLALAQFTVTPALAQPSTDTERCAQIVSRHESGWRGRDVDVSYRIGNVWTFFEPRFVEMNRGFAFTKRPGQFLNINCNRDDRVLELQEFYPIGLLVKPLMVVQTGSLKNEDGSPRFLNLVLTEYGHLKVIDEEDIQYLISGATYYFSDSNTRIFPCRDNEDCPGNKMTRTLPSGEVDEGVCNDDQCRRDYDIGPLSSYAIGPAVDPEGREKTSDWTRVEQVRQRINTEGFAALPADVSATVCDPFPVRLYKSGGKLHEVQRQRFPLKAYKDGGKLNDPHRHLYYLSLCQDRSLVNIPPIKIVTKETAEETFSQTLQGAFYRRFGEKHAAISEAVSGVRNSRLTGFKECSTRLEAANSLKASIGAGIKIDAGIVSLGTGVEVEVTDSFKRILSEDEHIRFAAYLAPDFSDGFVGEIGDARVFDFVLTSACDGTTLDSPKGMVIQHPFFDDEVLQISVQEMLTNPYAAHHGANLPGYIANTNASLLSEGRFFTIRDAQTYYLWRETVRVALQNTTLSNALFATPRDEQERVLDFFTHLIMAAAFQYNMKLEG